MTTISLKLPARLARQLDAAARARKTTRSAVVRSCLEHSLGGAPESSRGTFHELAGDLCGVDNGPRDLASHPKHLADFGE